MWHAAIRSDVYLNGLLVGVFHQCGCRWGSRMLLFVTQGHWRRRWSGLKNKSAWVFGVVCMHDSYSSYLNALTVGGLHHCWWGSGVPSFVTRWKGIRRQSGLKNHSLEITLFEVAWEYPCINWHHVTRLHAATAVMNTLFNRLLVGGL
jgi:hypothetical protein